MLAEHYHRPLSLDVADKPYAQNIKQRAEFEQLTVNRNRETGEFSAQIILAVDQYNSEGGAYGLRMQGNGIAAYPVTLYGNNNTAVTDAGAVALMREGNHKTGEFTESYANFIARCQADPRPLQLQGNWLENLFYDAPVKMADMVLGNMISANGAQFNEFAA